MKRKNIHRLQLARTTIHNFPAIARQPIMGGAITIPPRTHDFCTDTCLCMETWQQTCGACVPTLEITCQGCNPTMDTCACPLPQTQGGTCYLCMPSNHHEQTCFCIAG
jgi:hypothetical protein